MRFVFLSLAVILLCGSYSVQARMYKWVDEEGQMHFGDKIPQKYLVREHDVLNERGMRIKHREAVKTAEEKAEENRLEIERKKVARLEEKEKQLDRELLDAYSTEHELIVARDTRLDAAITQIQLSEKIIIGSKKKIESMKKQVTQIKASGREVPIDLYKRIDSEKQLVVVQSRMMGSHKKRSDEILEKYNGYIERFRVARPR